MNYYQVLRGFNQFKRGICSNHASLLWANVNGVRLGTSRVMSSTANRLDVSGIYPPIATPFDNKENIDWHKLQDNMHKWNKIDFKGFVVQGSNGEYAFLNSEERVELVRRVRDMAFKDKLIVAGSGCESTRDSILMSQRMSDAGADAVLVITPCYYKSSMTNSALEQHYNKVADESPVPLILYSVPANTGIDLAADVVVRLARHPNIIAIKDSAGDITKLGSMVYRTRGEDFQVLAGSAGFLFPSLAVGCVGGVCGLANILGEEVVRLMSLHAEGKMDEAKDLQHRLIAPNTGVTRGFGVPGLKVALEWFGYHGGPVRSPLLPLTDDQTKTLRQTFVDSGYLK